MKNIFKKNQIIITALAIMIVIAGYLSFTKDDTPEDPNAVETTNPDTDDYDIFTDTEGLDVVQNTDTTDDTTDDTDATDDTDDTDADTTADENDETTPVDTQDDQELGEATEEDILEAATDVTDTAELDIDDEEVPGEAILVSNPIEAGYFVSNRLEREQMRARNKEIFNQIIESPDVSQNLKQDAINRMIDLTKTAEKENATEIMLGARGFDDALVSISEGSVDVVINAPTLTEQQLAIIESVVKDKTGISVEHMNIVPVVMAE